MTIQAALFHLITHVYPKALLSWLFLSYKILYPMAFPQYSNSIMSALLSYNVLFSLFKHLSVVSQFLYCYKFALWFSMFSSVSLTSLTRSKLCSRTCMNLDICMHWEELEDVGGGSWTQRRMKISRARFLLLTNHRQISISTLIKAIARPEMQLPDLCKVISFVNGSCLFINRFPLPSLASLITLLFCL